MQGVTVQVTAKLCPATYKMAAFSNQPERVPQSLYLSYVEGE